MITEITNSVEQKHFYAKYGNEEYNFSIFFLNSENHLVFLQKNAMLYLEIDDNIFNPFHSATMIISNDQFYLEKSPIPYVFLGNGRDIVNINILPIYRGNFDKDSNDEKNKEHLGLNFCFVVIECQEIMYNNTLCKKLTLVEKQQYQMSESLWDVFSCAKAGGIVANYMETNTGNGKSTGKIIEDILYAVYNDGKQTDSLFYVDPSTKNKVFESDSNTKVSISPYGVMSYMEVLNYVMAYHAYKESPCVLQFDRYQKKFSLISLQTMFARNKDFVIETLKFASPSQKAYSLDNSNKQEKPAIIWEVFPVTFKESRINEFFTDSPASKYNVNLAGNSGILTNSRSTKSMVFNLKTLTSEQFTKKYYELFVMPFRDKFKTNNNETFEVFPNFYTNPNKKDNYNAYKGVLPPEMEESRYLNQKLKSLLYMNNIYQFKLNGKTHRKSLSFIDVVKTAELRNGQYVATKWDMNNLGRHFVTSVKHIFDLNTYRNEIETIKSYRLVDKSDKEISLKDFLAQGI